MAIKLHTYKEKNSPYWVVAFPSTHSSKQLEEIFYFCYNAFGPGLGEFRIENSQTVFRWVNDIKWGEVRFSREEDLNWFLLKWQ